MNLDWEHVQVLAFQAIAVLTLAMPALEKLAELTTTDIDNKVVDFLKQVLAYVPRVRLGKKP